MHTIRTAHIQRLIKSALTIAEDLDRRQAGTVYAPAEGQYDGQEARVEHALCKAVSDLRHAADELDAERLSCFGWRQQ